MLPKTGLPAEKNLQRRPRNRARHNPTPPNERPQHQHPLAAPMIHSLALALFVTSITPSAPTSASSLAAACAAALSLPSPLPALADGNKFPALDELISHALASDSALRKDIKKALQSLKTSAN